jgi:hypothetical protein
MKEIFVRWIGRASVIGIVAAGCARKSPPPATTLPATEPTIDASSPAAARVGELSRLSEEYSVLSHQLPGKTPDEYRQDMRKVFDQLAQILPLLSDPRSDLVFQQQLMVLEDARSQLSGNPPVATVNPTIDTGLRSAYNALGSVAHDKDFADSDYTSQLADMKMRIDELDAVRDLTHQVIVGEAVAASSVIVSKMAEELSSRVAIVTTTEASSQPTTGATPEPATGPTTSQPAATQPGAAAPAAK